ncbi:MAG: response regulator [Lachnoclostridium sp.]|nr:response regulator [Lachnoclostridium sp.]
MSNESKTKVIIVDDDPGASSKLKDLLKAYSDIEVIGCALNAEDGLDLISTIKPELVFIDIDLPDGNGLDMINRLYEQDVKPYIVMYTAFYEKFSGKGRAFTRGEHDYLLKPIDTRELDMTIQRYRYTSAPGKHESTFHPLSDLNNDPDDRIVVALTKVTSEIRVLHISDIGYFFYNSKRKLWEAVTRDNTIVSLKKTTTASDILAYSRKLIQTHQSYIVNLDYVMLIGKSKVNMFAPFQDADIQVGRIYFKNLQSRFLYL